MLSGPIIIAPLSFRTRAEALEATQKPTCLSKGLALLTKMVDVMGHKLSETLRKSETSRL